MTQQPQDAQEAPEISADGVAHQPGFPTLEQAEQAEKEGTE